jgi:aerobic carbon-monoxide dehydrogenase small subunit
MPRCQTIRAVSARVDETRTILVRVNGRDHEQQVSVRLSLADFLRENLGLTGTHLGCEHGVCGACTVTLDGAIVRSCLLLAVQCDGSEVGTIEGEGSLNELSVVQEAFWAKHGLQCGFCTSGMVLTATDFLSRNPRPSEEDVRDAMSGNLCRCTGYQFIVDAVLAAAEQLSAHT